MSMRMTKTIVAASICSMLLLLSFAAAPASAASKSKVLDLGFTEKVGPVEVPISSLGLDYEALAELIAELPEDAQELLMSVDSIYLDGMVHVNLKVWEKKDVCVVHLQFFWHGTIALLDAENNVLVGFDAKNIQVVVHAELPSCELAEMEVFANIHLNGALLVGDDGDVVSMDLKAHLLLRWEDGGFTMFKVWLPELGGLEIV